MTALKIDSVERNAGVKNCHSKDLYTFYILKIVGNFVMILEFIWKQSKNFILHFYTHHKAASWLHCSFLRGKKISFIQFFFQAQNDTELSFDKNERLEIIDKPPSDPDWYKARNTSGQIGLVPKNYLIELSQYLTQDVNKGSNGSASANNGHVNHVNQEEIKSQPWYFGTISRAECDSLLSEKGMDGDFMIRESETNVSKTIYYYF